MHKTSAIVVFAKAPLPDQAKTRLIPALGRDGAARLASLLLDFTLAECLATRATRIVLAQTPSPDDPTWEAFSLPAAVERWDQGDGDLGDRLARCSAQALADYDRILLIGTDAPALTTERLDAALDLLADYDAVLTPAHDGGYALLGLNRFDRALFSNMPWSTDRVAALTRARLAQAACTVHVTDAIADIDEPADLDALPEPLRERIVATS